MKKVLITGGTGAIGEELVKTFSKSYDVYFTFNTQKEKATQIAKKYKAKIADACSASDFDIIINNAAIDIFGDLALTVDDEIMQMHFDVNVMLPFKIIKQNLPHMIKQKWGRIINISSVCGIKPSTHVISYNVSKAALNMLTKSIAKEYAANGITCNAVAPSTLDEKGMGWEAIKFYGQTPKEFKEEYDACVNAVPAGRLGKIDEVAAAVEFLASDRASFINGVVLPVDGGLTI